MLQNKDVLNFKKIVDEELEDFVYPDSEQKTKDQAINALLSQRKESGQDTPSFLEI